MRSVDVVFPASMCAIIPMLRVSSSLNTRPIVPGVAFLSPDRITAVSATETSTFLLIQKPPTDERLPAQSLPPIVREGLVGFGHAMNVFLLLDRSAARIGGIDQFIRQPVDHGLAGAFPRILQNPSNRQRLPAKRIHFHRNLIVGAAHAPGLYFQQRLGVFDRLLEKLQGVVVGLFGHLIDPTLKTPRFGAILA